MDILDVLKKCNSEIVLKAKIFWTSIVFILIHTMSGIAVLLGFSNTPDYTFLQWVILFFFSFQLAKFKPLNVMHVQQHIFNFNHELQFYFRLYGHACCHIITVCSTSTCF